MISSANASRAEAAAPNGPIVGLTSGDELAAPHGGDRFDEVDSAPMLMRGPSEVLTTFGSKPHRARIPLSAIDSCALVFGADWEDSQLAELTHCP